MPLTPTVSRASQPREIPGLPAKVQDDTPSDSETRQEAFQEGGYGWIVVVSVWLINAHTWGLNSSFAVFLAYYLRNNVFAGGTPLAFAFTGGLSISIALLVSPIVTMSIGRLGTRTTLLIGTVFVSASFIACSFASQIWHLLLSQGVCFGLGMGFLFNGSIGLVPQWFVRRRSFASAIATSGSGFGGLTYSLATNAMIARLGLPWAFRIIGILAFVMNGLSSLFVRDRNRAIGAVHVAFDTSLLRRLEFWLYMLWGFFAIIPYIMVVFSVTDYALQVGFSSSQGSLAAALFNLSQGIGRPFIGLVSDKVGRINVAAFSTLIAGLAAFFIWTFGGKSFAGLVIYVLFGMFAGALWPTVAPVGAEVVGLNLLPSALSIYWLFLVLPSTFAEVIALELKNPGHDGYLDVQAVAGTLYVISFFCLWLLRSWKIQEMDALAMTDDERAADIRNGDVAHVAMEREKAPPLPRGLRMRIYLRNMLKVQKV